MPVAWMETGPSVVGVTVTVAEPPGWSAATRPPSMPSPE
jgi:hypothetical protein